jgi:hypothetical protein
LLQQNKDKILTESNEETEQEEQLLQQSRDSPHLQRQLPQVQQQEPQQEQQQSRAQRRKGRASKLNVNRICMKMSDEMNEEDPNKDQINDQMNDESHEKDEMNDESPKKDEVNDESSNETCESLHEESEVDHIITKINNATSLLQEILLDMYSLKNDAKPFN